MEINKELTQRFFRQIIEQKINEIKEKKPNVRICSICGDTENECPILIYNNGELCKDCVNIQKIMFN